MVERRAWVTIGLIISFWYGMPFSRCCRVVFRHIYLHQFFFSFQYFKFLCIGLRVCAHPSKTRGVVAASLVRQLLSLRSVPSSGRTLSSPQPMHLHLRSHHPPPQCHAIPASDDHLSLWAAVSTDTSLSFTLISCRLSKVSTE